VNESAAGGRLKMDCIALASYTHTLAHAAESRLKMDCIALASFTHTLAHAAELRMVI
jgi:hypothetical protein